FLATAYTAHPYGRAGVGWPSEISQVSATEAEAFHKKYYVPANIVVGVVGDLKAATAMPILERYFSRIPAGPKPEPMTTVEPPPRKVSAASTARSIPACSRSTPCPYLVTRLTRSAMPSTKSWTS